MTKFKSLDEMNEFMNEYDPFEIGENEKEEDYLEIINKHIKENIEDKGKVLTPAKLNGLLIKLENKYESIIKITI